MKSNWTEYVINLTANTVQPVQLQNPKANAVMVRNLSTTHIVYMDRNKMESSSPEYESIAPFDGYGFLVRDFPLGRVYLLASTNMKIRFFEIIADNPIQLIQNMQQSQTGDVRVTATVGLMATDLNLDVSGNVGVTIENAVAGVAMDGTDATGVTPLAGGAGIRGFLSSIYKVLSNTGIVVTTLPSLVLAAGSSLIGKVSIDQTTPGTTNGVQVNAALPAGTNLIGLFQEAGTGTFDGGTNASVTTTPGALGASQACKEVIVQADPSNAANILIGGSGAQYMKMVPGSVMSFPVSNVNLIYVTAASGTMAAHYIYRN